MARKWIDQCLTGLYPQVQMGLPKKHIMDPKKIMVRKRTFLSKEFRCLIHVLSAWKKSVQEFLTEPTCGPQKENVR